MAESWGRGWREGDRWRGGETGRVRQDWEEAFLHQTYSSDLWTGDGQDAAEIVRKAQTLPLNGGAKGETPIGKRGGTASGSAQGRQRTLRQGPEAIDISGKYLNAQMRER